MGVSVKVSIEVQDAEVQAVLKQLQQRTLPGGMTSVFRSLGRYGKTSTQLRFRTQTDPDGQRWRPSKRVLKHGGQTLRGKTSHLRNSMNWQLVPGGVQWGTSVPYAAAHQFGVDKEQHVPPHTRKVKVVFGRRLARPVSAKVAAFTRHMRIVPRRFLGVNSADRQAILGIMKEDLERSGAR